MSCPNCGREVDTFGGTEILLTDPPLPSGMVIIDPSHTLSSEWKVGCRVCLYDEGSDEPLPTREGGVG